MAQINGTSGNDTLNGTSSADTIVGLDGNDTIFGLDGNDLLAGDNTDTSGLGNDSIVAGAGDDTVLAGAGNDTVQSGDGNDLVDGGFGNDIITGDAGLDTLFGGFGDDIITGNDGNDILVGNEGADVMDGGSGDDLFLVDLGDLTVNGGAGTADTIILDPSFSATVTLDLRVAGNQNLSGFGPVVQGIEWVNASLLTVSVNLTGRNDTSSILVGSQNDDTINGGNMADLIRGGTGNDIIHGGSGGDVIVGEAGNDIFQFGLTETGTSLVADFTRGSDKIQILDATGVDILDALSSQTTIAGGFRQITIGTKTVLINDTGALTSADFVPAGPPVVIIPSATGTAGNDTLPLAVDTNGGQQILSGELDADGTIINGLGGTDVLRITGDASMRIDVTNPTSQLERLDLDGSGGFNGPAENNVAGGDNPHPVAVRNFEVFDAYPRQVLLDPANPSDSQRANNYFGNLYYDGTGFGGDGINTDGNIVLGGFGMDTVLSGIGNDFVAGGAGVDSLEGGRNADFFFIEGALLEPNIDDFTTINGGTTFDSNSDQDSDWILPEFSDDDEPILIDLSASRYLFFQGIQTQAGVQVYTRNIENVDASGNFYGFMDQVNTALGGARDSAIVGQGIGSTGQLRINGTDGNNIVIAGYDNDEVFTNDGDDIIFGGNLLFNVNPNIAGLIFDGRDSLFGGGGDDIVGYESFDVREDGGFSGPANDSVPGSDSLLVFDPDRANGITTQSQLIADRDEVSPGLPNAQRSIFGLVSNLAYDRDDLLADGTRLFNIDNPSPPSDTNDYLFIDLDAPNYAVLVTGNSSQDQTGGVNMTGFENVNGSGRNAAAAAYFGDSAALAAAHYLVGPIDPDGSNVGAANVLSFQATSVNLDIRGTDPTVTVASFTVPANGNDGTTHQVRMEEFGNNVLLGGEGTDRIEGRGGDDTLGGGVDAGGVPTPDLFVFDIRGELVREARVAVNDVGPFELDVYCDTFGIAQLDEAKLFDPNPFTDDTDPVSYDGNDTLTGDDQPEARRGDGHDVIVDFQVGEGANSFSQRADIDQVVFYEFNNGVQGYPEDRAAALTDDIVLDAVAGGVLDRDAVEAADTAVDLNATGAADGNDNAGIRADQDFSADLDDLQRFDVATLTVEGLSFRNSTLAAGQNQRQAAAQITNRVNFMAGLGSSLATMTASPSLVDYLGIGRFDDNADGVADNVDGNDINGPSIRIELNNFDKNVFYDVSLTVNNLSAGDVQADFFRLNNNTGSQILFEGFNGADGGFNDQNVLFLLRTATGVNATDGVSDSIQVQTSVLESARSAGSTVTGNADPNAGNYGDDQLFGGAGSDIINAGGGDDVIHGSLGSDAIDGGSGLDRLMYDRAAVGDVTVTINNFTQSTLGTGALGGTVGKTLGGTDTITGIEIIDKLGDVANGPTLGQSWSLISTDTLDFSPLSNAQNTNQDIGTLLFDLTNGNLFYRTEGNTLVGQAIVTGMDNVTGGDLNEQVLMGVKGVDTDQDGDIQPEFVLIDGAAAATVLVDAVVAPDAFRSNLIDLDNRTVPDTINGGERPEDGDGASDGNADGDPDDADRVIYCFDSLRVDYNMNGVFDNRPDLEVFVSATGEPSTTPGGILIPVDQTTDIVRMYEGFLDANPFNVNQVDDTLKNVEILNVQELDTSNPGPASTGGISQEFGTFTRYDIINVVTLSSVPNSDIPAILPTQYDGVVINYAGDQAIGGDLGQVDIDGDSLLDGDGVLEAGGIALGFEADEQQLIIQGIDEMEVVLAGSGNDRVISSPFFSRADDNQGGAEGTYHWMLQGGQDDMVDHRNFAWVGASTGAGVSVNVDFTNSFGTMFIDSEGNPVIEGFTDVISLNGNDSLAGNLSRTDFAYNVEDYIGGSFTASDNENDDATTVLYNPNTIDVQRFTNAADDAIGANSTADDVWIVFSDPGAGRFDPNNNQTSLEGHTVRTVSSSGAVFADFLDLDNTPNIDTSGTRANYWARVAGGTGDDFVSLDDQQTPQYHELNLGLGSNLVDYTRVGDNVGAPGAINTFFFQATSTNDTFSDIFSFIDGVVTDEVNVTEQDDQAGNGLQRELTLRGSNDPDIKDVLDLSPDSTIAGANSFGNGVFTPGTHFVSLGNLPGTVYNTSAPGASGIVLQGVLDIEALGSDDTSGTAAADLDDTYSIATGALTGGSNSGGLPSTVFTPTLYSSAGARSILDDISLASILEQSAREATGRSNSTLSNTSGTQLGNAQLGLQQMEVVNGNGLDANTSLVLFGNVGSRDTLFGGDGDDRIYATGDSADVLDAFRGIETMTGGVVTDFVGTFGSSTSTGTDAGTVGSTDHDTLAFIDNTAFNTLADGTYQIALNALGNSTTGGNEFIAGPTNIGKAYDFENFDAREVGVETFRDQYAANFGAPDGTSLSRFIVTAALPDANGVGSIIFGSNTFHTAAGTTNGDGGDSLYGGAGNDTIGGGFGGDLIVLDAVDNDGTASATDTATSDTAGQDVVVYQYTTDSTSNGAGITSHHVDVVQGFTVVGTITVTAADTTPGTLDNATLDAEEDRFDFRDVDANTQTTGVDDAFNFFNTLVVGGGAAAGIGPGFSVAGAIAANQNGVATLVFAPDATAGATSGTLYAYVDGDNNPDMTIKITGNDLESFGPANFLAL